MISLEGFAPPCAHGQAGGDQFCIFCLRTRGDHALEACDRLRAERNHLVETTELGALSERLEEDNAANDATMVRSAMHELAKLRADNATMARLLLKLEWHGFTGEADCPACAMREDEGHAAYCELVAVLRAAGVLP